MQHKPLHKHTRKTDENAVDFDRNRNLMERVLGDKFHQMWNTWEGGGEFLSITPGDKTSS